MTSSPTVRASWRHSPTNTRSWVAAVLLADTINPDESDFSSVISKIKSAGPDAIYYGGQYPQAGPLSQQAKAAGLKVPVMGGDGIFDP